jgi:Iap family predicted aminopeptidase
LGINDYANIKSVKGKIVVMRLGHPDYLNPHSKLAAAADIETKVNIAIDKGAEGIIIVNTHAEILEPDFKPIVKAPFKAAPIYFFGKQSGLDSVQFVNAKVSIQIDTVSLKLEGHNVIGFINHKAPQTVVIGAHYDHLGYNELGGSTYRKQQNEKPQIHNGADDNASGTAALIELAELLQKSPYRNHNYLFIAFSGEEQGLLGSRYFVDHPTIPLTQIDYMINMDMVGRLDTVKKTLAISGTGTSPQFTFLDSIYINGLQIKKSESGIGPSDHASFYKENIPVLHFFTGMHQDYHKPSDDEKYINYDGIYMVKNYIQNVLSKLNQREKLYFTKTKDSESTNAPKYKVSLGIMPDYIYEGQGVRADGVTEGKPAFAAGIKKGDIIIKLGDFTTADMGGYTKALSNFNKGDKTDIIIIRAGKELKISVVF